MWRCWGYPRQLHASAHVPPGPAAGQFRVLRAKRSRPASNPGVPTELPPNHLRSPAALESPSEMGWEAHQKQS